MFFKRKDKSVDQRSSDKQNQQFKNTGTSKESDSSKEKKKPLVDTSFVFFEEK